MKKLTVANLEIEIKTALASAGALHGKWFTAQEGPLKGFQFRCYRMQAWQGIPGELSWAEFNYAFPGETVVERSGNGRSLKSGKGGRTQCARLLMGKFQGGNEYYGAVLPMPEGYVL